MHFSEVARIGPPSATQIEVSIFGPNYGECIVIHLGNNHWIVVDSCLYGVDREPVCLAYLRAIGVNPETAIKAVVATHWHDDHYKGLSRILAAAPDAHIWISEALTDQEFLTFVTRIRKNRTAVAGTKLSEFSAIWNEIALRNSSGLVNFGFAGTRTSIYGVSQAESGHGLRCEICALSPSSGDYLNFLHRIAQHMPQRRKTKRSVPAAFPNDVSVATLVTIGDDLSILLGADLENSGKTTAGWEGVIANHRARRFGPMASLYKLPHHGSETGHNVDVWKDLVVANSFAVLTPWRRADGRLPTREGIAAIRTQTSRAYATATDARKHRTPRNRPPGVLRHLRESPSIRLRSLDAPFGAVRLRMDHPNSGIWKEELFGSACHLKRFVRTKPER